jgi:two-component system phosphate regulon response regulator PhoB
MSASVFLIHGDEELRRTAREALEGVGYAFDDAPDLLSAIGRIEAVHPELVLMSWTEPEPREGLWRLKQTPAALRMRVIVLAAAERLARAVGALEDGADDCLTVPFPREELIARVNACMRRAPIEIGAERLAAGPIVLDRTLHSLTVNGTPLELAPTEFRLLAFLLENQSRVFSRSELLRRAWAKHVKAGPRTVDVHVRRLRRVLEPFGCDGMIQTVRGFGYRFSAVARRPAARGLSMLPARLGRP